MVTLAPPEIKHVKKTWDLIKQDEVTHCAEVLIRIFEKHSDILAKFVRFDGVSFEEMRTSPGMRQHVGKIIQYLGAIIAILDEPHLMMQTFYMLGAVHHKRNATRSDFEIFRTEMIVYLKETFGESVSPDAISAFDKLLAEFVEQVSPHLKG